MPFALISEDSEMLADLLASDAELKADIDEKHTFVSDRDAAVPMSLLDTSSRPSVVFLFGSWNWMTRFQSNWRQASKQLPPAVIWLYRTEDLKAIPVHEPKPEGLTELWNVADPPVLRKIRQTALKLKLESEKQARGQLAKMQTSVQQREEFLSVCAHDLRAPLGLIQTSLSLIMNSAPTPENVAQQQELLSRAKRQAGHALGLVKDLLDVMSLEQGLKPQYKLVRLQDLLDDFCQDYKFQAKQKGIELHYTNAVPQWKVLLDTERIRQLLQNLITNALKFTESGRNIHLSVNPFHGRRKHDPPFPMIVLSIRDEGCGIPEKEMQRIFDRFAQLKPAAGNIDGRGLGLSVAKQISVLHDGNVWVESKEGQGSTFHVLFPHVVSRDSLDDEHHCDILVAEPSPKNRDAIFAKLSEWGGRVEFASDGVEAITKLFHFNAKVLVVTPDLPKIQTTEVCSILKADRLGSHIPLLLAGDTIGKPIDHYLIDSIVELPLSEVGWKKALSAAAASAAATRPASSTTSQGSSGAKTPRRVKAA